MAATSVLIDLTLEGQVEGSNEGGDVMLEGGLLRKQCQRCKRRGKKKTCQDCLKERFGSWMKCTYPQMNGEEVEIVSAVDEWTCQCCTFKNLCCWDQCSVCGHVRGNLIPRHRPQQGGKCPSCFEEIRLVDQFQVKCCAHTMCRDCASNYVNTEMRSNNIPIPCMVCKVDQCEMCRIGLEVVDDSGLKQCCKLSQQDVQQLLQGQEFERYLSLEGKQSVRNLQFFTCPGQDCGQAFEVDPQQIYFRCPECVFEFCLQCGVDWHKGSNCENYQKWRKDNEDGDDKFKQMKKSACPQCKHAVIKQNEWQCNKMYCTLCKIRFCFVCQQHIAKCKCKRRARFQRL
eukprot:TRINITY_DN35569_c0_g1_i1.p1 TRINITY_DN35569_c0_g1~~TRINITY_DN35569_c0_g1_i1.p1  ORF type:complete len:342 (-),score=40.28 TRINITY_DN35569_c0_g1_i1:639-1664(-)